MEKVKKFVEGNLFQNFILVIIVLNAVIMGFMTVQSLPVVLRRTLTILDTACLCIFIVELLMKVAVYRFHFFRSGWNLFDLVIVLLSLFSEFSFFSVFRIFRIFRVLRSLKALKSFRAFRLVSDLRNLRIIVEAVGRSIPGIFWSGMLLLLVYYIFAIMGTTLFGLQFPDWFGTMGKSFYTLFQVMTLESWSMGISRPVMEVFSWAWLYFVPFVLCTSFLIMNVVVGIVVNKAGKIKSIGISNFHGEKLERLLAECEIKPHVIQMEAHPYYMNTETIDMLKSYGCRVMAWYPLGHGDKALMEEPVFIKLAEKYGKSSAQVILRWHVQMGNQIIPGSTNPDHIRANADIFDFELTDAEMDEIAKINKNVRYYNPTPEMEEGYVSYTILL